MRQYTRSNYDYFKDEMCTLIFHSVPRLAIYDIDGRYGNVDRGIQIFLGAD